MTATADRTEIAKFDAMARDWWDPAGPMAPLHAMNPVRMGYVRDQACAEWGRDPASMRALEGLTACDVGCGAGLAAEPLARMGFDVTGVDASGPAIAAARAHATAGGLEIAYREGLAADLVAQGSTFDLVTCLEVIEHASDPGALIAELAALARPGGLVAISTLNRTARSFAGAIVGAEWLLGWLPRGTHDWRRFVTPEECRDMMEVAGLSVVDRIGMVPDPLRRGWRLSDDMAVNYVALGRRP
ncbi:MAG: bifunctional 2-polyprenyl-6-hydroxyphenol methylase/3-demethylubiquinol 3-O-methyltransferase UbiG [Paracoccaceae bacterium]